MGELERASVHGLVLAAGEGTRYGRPKALVIAGDGTPWVAQAIRTLRDGGCDDVTVAVGAAADLAAALVPASATVLRVDGWAEGLSATLKAGLAHAAASGVDALVIVPVDTPAMPSAAVRRVIKAAGSATDTALIQAVYDGAPGHPVLIGRAHFDSIAAELRGDRGARGALVTRGVRDLECSGLWSGADVDRPGGVAVRPR